MTRQKKPSYTHNIHYAQKRAIKTEQNASVAVQNNTIYPETNVPSFLFTNLSVMRLVT